MRLVSIFILFILMGIGVQAQVSFVVKASKKTLGINERLRIDFEMNEDGDNFVPPSFKGFNVVGGPNQSISNSWINGKRSYSKTYSYFLAPKSQGTFSINQATIEIDDQIYKTTPLKIIITEAVSKPKDGNSADYVASENVHLIAEVSKSNPFLNEAITIVYKLYVSNDVSITRSWQELDTPKFQDFWSQYIEEKGEQQIYETTYEGKPYRYVILRKAVLYPQKTGELTIEPLTLDVPIDVQGNTRDIFGRRRMTRVNRTISAGKRIINVKPLPTEGRPNDFSGAVGNFNFSVSVNKTMLDANEALELKIRTKGIGNLKLFNLPSLTLPSSLEVYEPVRDNKVAINIKGMNGFISDTYTIIPQYKGSYPIRPISFSYFDVTSSKYKTIISDEIVVKVQNGPVPNQLTEVNKSLSTENDLPLTNNQFKYIKTSTKFISMNDLVFFKTFKFWCLLSIPFVFIPIIILIGNTRRKRLNDIEGRRYRIATRLAKKYLSEAKNNIGKQELFYDSLERALHNYLKAKLAIVTSEFSKEKIIELLTDRKVEKNVVSDFEELLKSCEFARYTPTSNVAIQQDYNKAVKVISRIDKQFQ
ncbi:BatD family protein [Flavobacteriaceae bacterium]|nr:BatD family protein [Flavobacteriaceae bacterium]MDC6467710.1 BatD family protein [Flavobacteriaceae bacterium]